MHLFTQRPSTASRKTLKLSYIAKVAAPLFVGVGLLALLLPAFGSPDLALRSLQLSNSQASQVGQYEVAFTIQDASAVGSLKLEFCSNSPLEGFSCTAPNGFDVSNASLVQSNGFIDMSITNRTANSLVLSRPPTPVTPPLTVIFTLTGVTNPSDNGSYYLKLSTYGSVDASGSRISFGAMAFAINTIINISAEVPPYLLFCAGVTISGLDCSNVTGNYINFGNLSVNQSSSAASQFLAATNAANGYNVSVSGTSLTSGNNVISALSAQDISRPGVSQFGMNLRANSDPSIGADPTGPGSGQPSTDYNTPDKYTFRSGDIVAGSGAVEDYRKYTASYIVNISRNQASGVYASTLTYTSTANF